MRCQLEDERFLGTTDKAQIAQIWKAVCDKDKPLGGVMLDSDFTFTGHVTHASERAVGRQKVQCRFRLCILLESAKRQITDSNSFFTAQEDNSLT